MIPSISEILKKVQDLPANKRVEELRRNDNPILRKVLRLAFDKDATWLLPEGKPPFNRNDLDDQEGNLYMEWRKFYLFFPGGNDNLTQARREMIFIQVLETISGDDADLICAVKDHQMPYKGITRQVVAKAFPGIFD